MGYVMNKKSIIITAVIVIAAAIIIILATGTYPPDDSEKAAGAIGKVEKHRDPGIEGKDIELRSDFIESDDKIRKLVRDLTIYNIILNRLSFILGDIKYDQFCGKLPDNNANICDKLIDLREFVDNSNEKIVKTITTVAGAYENDNPPTSDIENQMIIVADFHNHFMKKNDVLNEVIADLDRIINDPKASKNFGNIDELIKLRDVLLITNFDIAARLGDKENFEFASGKDINNTDILKDITSGKSGVSSSFGLFNKLEAAYGNQKLNIFGSHGSDISGFLSTAIFSEESLQIFGSKEDLNNALNQDKLEMTYAGSNLKVIMVNEKGLEAAMSSEQLNDIIIPKVVMSSEQLGVYNNEKLNDIVVPPATINIFGAFNSDNLGFLSQEDLNSVMSSGDLNVLANEDITKVFMGVGDLNSSLGGIIFHSSQKLDSY